MRRSPAVTALLLSIALLAPASVAAKRDDSVGRLRVNDSVFWSHPRPLSGQVSRSWNLELLEAGSRLRVAIDSSTMDDWRIQIESPQGLQSSSGPYSAEAFLTDPRPGIYKITATANSSRSLIRLRAKLEGRPKPRGKGRLLPNLRVTPPFDLTLKGHPWYFDFVYVPNPPSCFPEETAQALVTRCLRFSFGPENAGEGPLELIYAAPADEGGQNVMYQQITHGDGRKTRRKAGTYEYHAAHGHYHHPLLAGQQLFKVTDPRKGRLEAAGEAKKTGFCMGDYTLVDWHRFYQDRINTVTSSCGLANVPTEDLVMGLSTGWNDIYSYYLEGNYIDFDEGTDGLYVLRAFTDQSGGIAETNERDNLGYAYFKVTGDEIRLLERGYGADPWDRNKKVLRDPRNYSVPFAP